MRGVDRSMLREGADAAFVKFDIGLWKGWPRVAEAEKGQP